jgi:hypothetical protein
LLGSFVDIGLGTGCNCGGDEAQIPTEQFTLDQETDYTISASYTAAGIARSEIASALAMTSAPSSQVFSYNNLTNAPDNYTFSGTLEPGTYTLFGFYSLDNTTEGASPAGASGTGSINFALSDETPDAADPEPATLVLPVMGLSWLWVGKRGGKGRLTTGHILNNPALVTEQRP